MKERPEWLSNHQVGYDVYQFCTIALPIADERRRGDGMASVVRVQRIGIKRWVPDDSDGCCPVYKGRHLAENIVHLGPIAIRLYP